MHNIIIVEIPPEQNPNWLFNDIHEYLIRLKQFKLHPFL